jgi:Arc/MetJ family transcription regulator
VCMTRTNIDIDDELIESVMRRYGIRSKREAVHVALRRMYRPPMSRDEMLALEGTGWGDNGLELSDLRPGYIPFDE